MHNIKKLNDGYCGFFKAMGSFAHSPLSKTAESIFENMSKPSGGSEARGFGALIGTGFTMMALSPVLLPLTAITAVIALVLVVLAALTAPLTYPVAALMDCCDDSKEEPSLAPM